MSLKASARTDPLSLPLHPIDKIKPFDQAHCQQSEKCLGEWQSRAAKDWTINSTQERSEALGAMIQYASVSFTEM